MLRMRRTTRDILSDEHGVSIVFAVILVVVLLVIGGILVTTGYANFSRATSDVPAEQNEKTVASAAAFVQGKMDGATVAAIGGNPSQGFTSDDMPWIENLLKEDDGTVTLSVEGGGLPADALQDVTLEARPEKGSGAGSQDSPTAFSVFVYVADDNNNASGTVMKIKVTATRLADNSYILQASTPMKAGDGA